MADSSIAITPGVGTNVDTFTQASGDHRQAVVIGDATAAYTVAVDSAGRITTLSGDPDSVGGGPITATDTTGGTHAGAGVPITAAPSSAASYTFLATAGGDSSFTVDLSGTFGGGTFWIEASMNSTNGVDGSWLPLESRRVGTLSEQQYGGSVAPTSAGQYRGTVSGAKYIRVRTTGATSPNVTAVIRTTSGTSATAIVGKVTRSIDGARTRVSMNYSSTAPVVADTLLTLSLNKGGTASSVTTVPVSAGKVLRITSIIVSLRATAATLPYGLVTLRINDSGAAAIGSSAIYVVGVSGTAAVIGNTGTMSASIEDGLELSGTAQLGISFSNNVNTNVANITVLGYEYAP